MIDKKLLEQLQLAKQAGTQAMAKDFFAPTPGAGQEEGSPEEEASESPDEAKAEGDMPGGGMEVHAKTDSITPEQLEELLRMLGGEGGGGQ
jgi:hypothetical protein